MDGRVGVSITGSDIISHIKLRKAKFLDEETEDGKMELAAELGEKEKS